MTEPRKTFLGELEISEPTTELVLETTLVTSVKMRATSVVGLQKTGQ